jgi:hypothetical protein
MLSDLFYRSIGKLAVRFFEKIIQILSIKALKACTCAPQADVRGGSSSNPD